VPARFDAAMWPRLDAGGIPDGATVRLDDYTLRCAADGRGDWCVRCFAAPQRVLFSCGGDCLSPDTRGRGVA